MPWMWGPGYGWAGLLMMSVWGLVWLALNGLVVWAIVRGLLSRGQSMLPPPSDVHPPREEPSALEVLRRRYARGEIDAATFETMRERLNASGAREPTSIPSA